MINHGGEVYGGFSLRVVRGCLRKPEQWPKDRQGQVRKDSHCAGHCAANEPARRCAKCERTFIAPISLPKNLSQIIKGRYGSPNCARP